MTTEEKQLLLKELCARLPYGVKGKIYDSNYTAILKDVRYSCFYPLLVLPLECPLTNDECSLGVDEFKPYLRPMSSMTEEERKELSNYENPVQRTDFFYSHHIDCRFMIEKGLALVAPKGMYKTE